MTYRNPIGRYKPAKGYRSKARRAGIKAAPSRPACGQGIVRGDERYCPGCGKFWPKDEDHP